MRLVYYNSITGRPEDLEAANLSSMTAYREQLELHAVRRWGRNNGRYWRIVQQLPATCMVPLKAVSLPDSGCAGEVIVAEPDDDARRVLDAIRSLTTIPGDIGGHAPSPETEAKRVGGWAAE